MKQKAKSNRSCEVVSTSQIIKDNEKVFDAWFENWLVSHVPRLLQQNKCFTRKVTLSCFWNRIRNCHLNTNMASWLTLSLVDIVKVRKASVKYKNANEKMFRETRRAARTLVVIHHVDELDIVTELNSIGSFIEKKYRNVGCWIWFMGRVWENCVSL